MTISDFRLKLDTLTEYVTRVRRTKPLTVLMNGKGRRYGCMIVEDGTFLLEDEEPYTLHGNSYSVPIKNVAWIIGLSSSVRKEALPLSVYSSYKIVRSGGYNVYI